MRENENAILFEEIELPSGKVAILSLNRPSQMNAMNGEIVEGLKTAFEKLQNDTQIRVVILTAVGEKAFCVGADLKERKTMTDTKISQRIADYKTSFDVISKLNKPVICAINGYAFGGGLEIALACDFRIASETATLGLTETSLGIMPGAGGTQRLSRLVGSTQAKELIFGAIRLSSKEAKSLGIISRISLAGNLLNDAKAWANALARSAPLALAQAKLAIDRGIEMPIDKALDFEAKCYQRLIPTRDRLEGMHAFAEKRAPQWEGK